MRTISLMLCLIAASPVALAQDAATTAPAAPAVAPAEATAPAPADAVAATHDALRKVRDEIIAAWDKRDVDALLSHVAPNVVVTWQNGEVSRGHAGVRKFYEEVMGTDNKLIADMKSTFKVDELSILYGDSTAIAFGSIHDDITFQRAVARAPFMGSGTMSLDSRWTATLVKLDGDWKIAAYHVSMDAFANPILDKALAVGKRLAMVAGAIALVIGLLLGWLTGRRRAA